MKQTETVRVRLAATILAWSLAIVGPAVAGLFEKTLEGVPAYRDLPKASHTPAFRVQPFPPAPHAKDTEWYWVYDGQQKVGLVQTWTKEIEMFRFTLPPPGKTVEYAIPAIHHFGTLVGVKINIYAPEFSVPHEPIKLDWISREGPVLEFKTVDKMKNGAEGENSFRLAWDETLGYVWQCRTHYRMQKPMEIEFNNLLAGGVSDSRDDHKRWQKVLRGEAPGKMTWFYHNPLNVPRRGMASDGFVGFVRDPDMNPFVELEAVNATVSMATCSQWYDQHIIAGALKAPEADGLFHLRASYRFLSIPASVAAALEDKAEPINSADSSARGFLAGVTNDFERGISGGQVYNGPIWRQPFSVDATQGHSGKSSVRLAGLGKGKLVCSSPIGGGPAVYGESAKRYRLSAWVKSELEEGEAYLQADDCFWNWEDLRATRRTKGIAGKTGWTELSVEFQPGPDNPFLLIKLCVDGKGDAWFDDLALMEVR